MTSHVVHSPAINKLPVELLITVFLHSLPTSYTILTKRPFQKSITDPPLIPLVLASVCQAWRSLVCSTPRLWENCWLSYNRPDFNKIWLDRAGNQMLKLHAQCTEPTTRLWQNRGKRGEIAGREAFMAFILQYRQRWILLNLDTGPFKRGWMRGPAAELDAPALQTFTVHDDRELGSGVRPDPTWVRLLALNAPSLRKLKLHHSDGITFSQNQFLHLVDLEIGYTAMGEVLVVLDGLPRLQKFAVRTQDADNGTLQHIYHNNLTHFHYTGEWGNTLILSYITLPSLRSLHLASTSLRMLPPFLDRSQCSITELVLSDTAIDDDELSSILAHRSVDCRLERLKLDHCLSGYITPQSLRFLQYDPEDPHLISLESLSITGYHFLALQEGLLADAIGSRCRPHLCDQKEVKLRYLSVGHLMHSTHCLDIARMAPLPKPPYLTDDDPLFIELYLPVDPVKFTTGRPSSDSYPDGDLY